MQVLVAQTVDHPSNRSIISNFVRPHTPATEVETARQGKGYVAPASSQESEKGKKKKALMSV